MSKKTAKKAPLKQLTKDGLLGALRSMASELKSTPSQTQFLKVGVSKSAWQKYFDSYNQFVEAAGLEPNNRFKRMDDDVLLADYGRVVKEHGQIPTKVHYSRKGKYDYSTFRKRFGPWSEIPEKFRQFAAGKSEWKSVLSLLPPAPKHINVQSNTAATADTKSKKLANDVKPLRAVFGAPIDFRGLRHEPVNEQGVVFLFGMIADELGFSVEAIQTGFPDCEAKRYIDEERMQRVRIEFEFESKNFQNHGHAAAQCDIVVCWRDNWRNPPGNLEIIELKSILPNLAKSVDEQ